MSLLILISYILSAKEKSYQHNYGLGKFEDIGVFGIIFIFFFLSFYNIYQSFYKFQNHLPIEGAALGLILFIFLFLKNIYISFELKKLTTPGKLETTSSANNIYKFFVYFNLISITIFTLEMILHQNIRLTLIIDAVGTLILTAALFIRLSILLYGTTENLLDSSASEAKQIIILRCLAAHFDEYNQIHEIRTRQSGPVLFAEIFLEFEENIKMSEYYILSEKIKNTLKKELPEIELAIVPTSSSTKE